MVREQYLTGHIKIKMNNAKHQNKHDYLNIGQNYPETEINDYLDRCTFIIMMTY